MKEELKIKRNVEFYKKEYDGAMIMFRVSGFYEMYDVDAIKASEILGICRILREGYYMVGFPNNKLDEYLPKLHQKGYRVVITDLIDIEDDDTTLQVYEDKTAKFGFESDNNNNDNKPTKNTKDMNEKTINNIKVMGIATETIKALKGELPATLADYLYDAIGKLEVIKIKHKLNLTPNRSEIAYLIEQAEINRGE
jgi:DNA mismatch repair protein MutS